MKQIAKTLLSFFCTLTFFAQISIAQEYIHTDAEIIYPTVKDLPSPAKRTTATPPDTLILPLVDDFSYDSLFVRMGGIWDINPTSIHRPGVSIAKGIGTPTKGVAVFDGATRIGKKYKNTLQSGWSDSLTSNPIDLSGHVVGDSIYLSFFIEPGGLGDRPEGTDSFCVFFDSTGNYDWVLITAIHGDSINLQGDSLTGEALLSDEFYHVMIPVDTALYLHSAFRFKFATYGSLNGEFDVWNVDYVRLDAGRSLSDTIIEDVSVIYHHNPLMGEFSAVPQNIYNIQGGMSGTKIETNNLGATNRTRNLNIDLRSPDPVGGSVFSGTTSNNASVTVNKFSNSMDSLPAFSAQSFSQSGVFETKTFIDADGSDVNSANDTMTIRYRVDSVFAYDDGIADVAYGLTSPKGFCQRFTMPDTLYDTLEAVWINFVPTLYYNGTTQQSTCMEGQSFKVGLWNDVGGLPDTLVKIYLSGMIINYGPSLNGFVRYALTPATRVPQTFYLGIVQNGVESVGIGVDKNFDSSDKIYFQDQFFDWTPTAQLAGASLMLRPEFKNSSSFVGRLANKRRPEAMISVYPNPVSSNEFHLRLEGELEILTVNVSLLNLQGKEILRKVWQNPSRDLSIPFDSELSSGLYLVDINLQTKGGQRVHEVRKLMVSGR